MCTLYERIQELCKRKGVSGSRMCIDLGLSKSTLSDIKGGRKKGISTETAQKMAAYLSVSVDELLGKDIKESPDEYQLTEGEKAFIRLIRRLPADLRPIVYEKILAEIDAQG